MRRIPALVVVFACTDPSFVADAGSGADTGTTPRADGGADSGREPDDAALARFDVAPFDAGEHAASPRLVDLPANTALDLGPYECRSRVPEERLRCELITDYSRLSYDPYFHRLLMFGGGHAATGRTDVEVFDLATFEWSSLYASMTCDEIAAGDIDPRGFHRATGHPVARHTYDQNVIAEVGGVGRLLMLSTEGFPGHCHDYNATIRSIASLPLVPGEARWEYSDEGRLPWNYASPAELDPISGYVIVVGAGAGSSDGGMWVLDPATNEVVAFETEVGHNRIDGDLVFFPPNGNMYEITGGQVRELVLDRDDWSRSTSTILETTGPAGENRGFAYDARNAIIGGSLREGIFHAFDPATRTWTSETIRSDAGTVGSAPSHILDYDPVNNVYYFIARGDAGRRTWAYRYR